MTKSVNALINPKLLKWARENSGITVELAAKKLSQKVETIDLWESGDKKPTFKQLINISKTYKRPISIFYLEKPPKDFRPLRDYRKISGVSLLTQSSQLNYEIRKAYYRRQVALDLLEELKEKPQDIEESINLSDNREDIGKKIRAILNIDKDTQINWKNDSDAFNSWRESIESLGILVFQAERVKTDEMRGFAISDRPLPIIVVNKKDSYKGRIFSLFHELSHILLEDSSISGDINEQNKVEVFCNHIASSILLPSDWFETDELLIQYRFKNWDNSMVDIASQRFHVSREFMWRKLLILNKVDHVTYQRKRADLIKEFEKQKVKDKESKKNIVVPYHNRVVSSIGRFYTKLVLSGYYQEKITSSTLSDYLGIKLNHLQKVENTIFKQSRGVL